MAGIDGQVKLIGKMIGELEAYLAKEYRAWRVAANGIDNREQKQTDVSGMVANYEQKQAIAAGMAANRKAALRLTIIGDVFKKIRKQSKERRDGDGIAD